MEILVCQQNHYQWRTLHTHIPARPVTSMERLPHLLEMLGLVCVVNWEQMSVTFTLILILKHHLSSENKYILLKSNKIFLNALLFISIQSVCVSQPYSKIRTTIWIFVHLYIHEYRQCRVCVISESITIKEHDGKSAIFDKTSNYYQTKNNYITFLPFWG